MTLSEICRLHKIELPEPDGWGRIKFVNPDANTERAFCALSDYQIDLNFWVHPQEREHIIVLKRK